MSYQGLTLTQIAAKINAHLKRFEADKKINALRERGGTRTAPYYYASAVRLGSRVGIGYVCYQGRSSVTRDVAERYAEWLDEGNVGTHYEMERVK